MNIVTQTLDTYRDKIKEHLLDPEVAKNTALLHDIIGCVLEPEIGETEENIMNMMSHMVSNDPTPYELEWI